jgi:23S rRNA (adenine2030-N6)-methyltransferase
MNYRHAFHAGSHADVVKHAVLALCLAHLAKKEKGFAVLDVHAGIGLYALDGPEASRTLEWRDGVARLYDPLGAPLALDATAEDVLRPWRAAVAKVNPPGRAISYYPGSPEIARQALRPQDRLILNELHADDQQTLARRYAGRHVELMARDATEALRAKLPPEERRGLVLIDPAYERTDDAETAVAMLADGIRRFATGLYVLWYPVTGDGLSDRLVAMVKALEPETCLRIEMHVRTVEREKGLAGAGMILVNPPWQLDRQLEALMPPLAERLRQGSHARTILTWLTNERVR